jgi:hypothetical protein
LGRDGVGDYLSIAEQLVGDRSAAVIGLLVDHLTYIADYLVSDPQRAAYQRWIRRILQPVAGELGWNSSPREPADQPARRANLLYTLGWAGADLETLRTARGITDQYLSGGAVKRDPAIVTTAIRLAATNGDRALYDRMLARMRSSSDPSERQRFLNALGRFTDPALITRTIDLAFSDEVRSQDAPGLFRVLLSNPSARQTTWETMKARWPELEHRFGVFQGIAGIVESTKVFCDSTAREDVKRFFEQHKMLAAERSLRQSLESIDACIALKARTEESLREFLKSTDEG